MGMVFLSFKQTCMLQTHSHMNRFLVALKFNFSCTYCWLENANPYLVCRVQIITKCFSYQIPIAVNISSIDYKQFKLFYLRKTYERKTRGFGYLWQIRKLKCFVVKLLYSYMVYIFSLQLSAFCFVCISHVTFIVHKILPQGLKSSLFLQITTVLFIHEFTFDFI